MQGQDIPNMSFKYWSKKEHRCRGQMTIKKVIDNIKSALSQNINYNLDLIQNKAQNSPNFLTHVINIDQVKIKIHDYAKKITNDLKIVL